MTGRIVAGFLAVLTAVLVAVVVPLGLVVTAQQGRDFADQLDRAAAAVGAVAEEHLDDHATTAGLQGVLDRLTADGDRIVILDAHGDTVARAGAAIPAATLRAAAAGTRLPAVDDTLTVTTSIQDGGRTLGRVVLSRETTTLETRRHQLWVALGVAGVGALAAGVLIAWLLSRWIARPLTGLARVALGLGSGRTAARADERSGPMPVRQVAAAFNTMSDRVRALLETQRGMTAEVSHQLRTPLAALRLRLELHRDELEPADQAADVTGMIDEIERLTRLLDGLLALARAEATPADPARTDIAPVAAARAETWQPVADDRQVRLRIDTAPADADITPGHLEQILDNLIDNAIEATPAGGQVTITVRAGSHGAELTVADTGRGMTAEQRERALDRWTTTGGTGLGLAIVQRLVAADGGTLRLDTAPGAGLRATVAFPPARRPAHPLARRSAAISDRPA